MPDRHAAAAFVTKAMGSLNNGELAARAGVDPGTIGDFLAGKTWPQRKNRARIEEALGLPAGSIEEAAAVGPRPQAAAPEPTPNIVPMQMVYEGQLSLDLGWNIDDFRIRLEVSRPQVPGRPMADDDFDVLNDLAEAIRGAVKDWRSAQRQADAVATATGIESEQYTRAAHTGPNRGEDLRAELDRQSELVSPPPDHDDGA